MSKVGKGGFVYPLILLKIPIILVQDHLSTLIYK